MSEPRICLLVAYYPPSAESGARRPYNLVRRLRQAGLAVDVIVAGPGDVTPTTGDFGETIRYTVRPRTGLASRLTRLWDRIRIRVRRLFLSEFDPAVRVRGPLTRLLRAHLRSHDAILYVSQPPAGLGALAVQAARSVRPDQRVVLEFRDPWTTEVTGPRLAVCKPRYERRRLATLAAADAIVAVTSGIAARMSTGGVRHAPVVAMNGVPDDLLARASSAPRDADRTLRLLYLGEFYLSRDPTPLLDALAALRRRAPELAGRIELQLIGEVEHTPGGLIGDLLAARGLDGCTTISGRVGYDEAKRLLDEADLFLLLAQQQPLQVPNKLYEYLAYRRPILTIADEDGETARVLRATGHAETLVFPGSAPARVEQATEAALAAARRGDAAGDARAIAELASSRQLDKVVALLTELGAR